MAETNLPSRAPPVSRRIRTPGRSPKRGTFRAAAAAGRAGRPAAGDRTGSARAGSGASP